VRVVWYAYEKLQVGPVTLGVLRPVRVYESEEAGSPVDIMLSIVEAATRRAQGDYLEVRVEGEGVVEWMGESPRYRAQRLLFPRPARLRRVGVLTREALEGAERGIGYVDVGLESVKWIPVGGEVYVYEGTLAAPDDVIAVYLDTDEGVRLVFNPAYERNLKAVLLQTGLGGGSQQGEPGSGGDSSPSE